MEETTYLKKKSKGKIKDFLKAHSYEITAYLGFIICLIIFSILPPLIKGPRVSIWKPAALKVFIEQVTVYLILGIGASFVYMMGSMDISVGYQVGVFSTLFIIITNATGSAVVAILTILALGVICAIFNAIIGAYVKLPTVMSSVILMQLFSGLMAHFYTDSSLASRSLKEFDLSFATSTSFRIISIIVLVIVGVYLANYTKIGKKARAIGANKKAADQSGASILKTRLICYSIFSVFLVLAGIFLMAKTNGLSDGSTSNYQMDIMIMLLMGGMPLSGGMRCKISNAVVGALTYYIIQFGLKLCGVPANYIMLTQSIIFITIVILTCRKPGSLLPR